MSVIRVCAPIQVEGKRLIIHKDYKHDNPSQYANVFTYSRNMFREDLGKAITLMSEEEKQAMTVFFSHMTSIELEETTTVGPGLVVHIGS